MPSIPEETFKIPCLIWTGATDQKGYGVFRAYDGAMNLKAGLVRVHRYNYWIHYGPFLANMQVDHRCRNKLCLEPTHLQLISIERHALKSNEEKKVNKLLDSIMEDILK